MINSVLVLRSSLRINPTIYTLRYFSIDRRYRQDTKKDTDKIPYAVKRTSSGNLPVYVKTRGPLRETVTSVGGIFGDVNAFKADLRMVIGGNLPMKDEGRTVELSGPYGKQIKRWLQSLGF